MTEVTARRTTLRDGAAADYERIHRTIPSAVSASLRAAGVVEWSIWRDEDRLLHHVVTTNGYDAMVDAISQHEPVDPPWDAAITGLLRSEPGDDVILPLVWSLSNDN